MIIGIEFNYSQETLDKLNAEKKENPEFTYFGDGWDMVSIDTKKYNIPMPRVGDIVSAWPNNDVMSDYCDLVVESVEYLIHFDKEGLPDSSFEAESFESPRVRVVLTERKKGWIN